MNITPPNDAKFSHFHEVIPRIFGGISSQNLSWKTGALNITVRTMPRIQHHHVMYKRNNHFIYFEARGYYATR